jgi:hypothetical protein
MKYMLKSLKECRVNHKWICDLYRKGFGIAEIVRQTGYNRNTVKSHVIAEGIYIPGSKSERKREEENKLKNPPPDISDYKNIEIICQEEKEKIFEEELGIGGEELELAREEEQEVVEADSITRYKDENTLGLLASNDQHQITEIDKVINHCLKLLKDKDRLKRAKTSVINTVFATMVEKKKMLQGLNPKGDNVNQVIVNFFANRDFANEVKKMKALKDKSM